MRLFAPTSWAGLSQRQLRYTLWLLTNLSDPLEIKTSMLIRFCGIRPLRRSRRGWRCRIPVGRHGWVTLFLPAEQIAELADQFSFIERQQDFACRLETVGRDVELRAADLLLHGMRFGDYLMAEKYYQLFIGRAGSDLAASLDGESGELLDGLALWLYAYPDGHHAGQSDDDPELILSREERLGTFLWFSWVKLQMAQAFPCFFRPSAAGDGGTAMSGKDILQQYNVQLRLLTGGDPTREAMVLDLDCWRCLTELDAKARDAAEMERIRKKGA